MTHKKLTITIEEGFIKEIKDFSKNHDINVSTILRAGAKMFMENYKKSLTT